MGLLLDLSPGGGMEDGGNEEDLEADCTLALMGDGGGKSTPNKHGGKAPVPMAEIDLDDEEDLGDEDLDSDDEDLLAELNELLEDEEETPKSAPPATVVAPPKPSSAPAAPSCESGPEARLLEHMYQTAVDNAKSSGESSKARRYELKPEPIKERHQPAPNLMPSPPANQKPLREAPPPVIPNAKAHFLSPPKTPLEFKQAVLSRQREYKIAAIRAMQLAKQHYLIAKKLDPVMEALDRGESLDLRSLPPPPGCPPLPGLKADVLETAMKLANQDTDAEVQEEEGSRADVAKAQERGRPLWPSKQLSSSVQLLHSFSLLHYDKDNLQRRLGEHKKTHRRPMDLLHKFREVSHRLKWQKAYLEKGSPALCADFEHVLCNVVHGLNDSVKKLSDQGDMDAANEALRKLSLVNAELRSLKRKGNEK
ncbi:hypothetical protein NHX12_018135 [Muraenolepis orangiensis]|uniref:DM14 domain-containing protein n=1 Tax=Muraenolepis orangiensis TaxID=630683 RepID=A0A9Q0IYC4_9TELE|nr:hypothetical protein NHX12_018135 [Muraenolepis orangiensis]